MSQSLTPGEDTPSRTLDEMLDLLRCSFRVVQFDREMGDEHIQSMIEHWNRMKLGYARHKNPPPAAAQIDAHIKEANRKVGNAAFVLVADDPNDEDQSVRFNLVPDDEILIGFANRAHEDAATGLVERIAVVLEYDSKLC